MSIPSSFVNTYVNTIQNLINTVQDLRLQNDMLTQDPTLITRYFNASITPNSRTDIVAADITAAQGAITQMLFTFDSGNPTQKAALFKMLQ